MRSDSSHLRSAVPLRTTNGSASNGGEPPRPSRGLLPEAAELGQAEPYGISDVLASGAFVSEAELQRALDRLNSKKNLILQGPPGVGKNFIARKLAYALIEARDDGRIEMVQFHQSYSYEDFIRGYRPGKGGQFELKDGIFFNFCSRANADPDRPYVFIIDEINRGNPQPDIR